MGPRAGATAEPRSVGKWAAWASIASTGGMRERAGSQPPPSAAAARRRNWGSTDPILRIRTSFGSRPIPYQGARQHAKLLLPISAAILLAPRGFASIRRVPQITLGSRCPAAPPPATSSVALAPTHLRERGGDPLRSPRTSPARCGHGHVVPMPRTSIRTSIGPRRLGERIHRDRGVALQGGGIPSRMARAPRSTTSSSGETAPRAPARGSTWGRAPPPGSTTPWPGRTGTPMPPSPGTLTGFSSRTRAAWWNTASSGGGTRTVCMSPAP
jgi:hypothetical protein